MYTSWSLRMMLMIKLLIQLWGSLVKTTRLVQMFGMKSQFKFKGLGMKYWLCHMYLYRFHTREFPELWVDYLVTDEVSLFGSNQHDDIIKPSIWSLTTSFILQYRVKNFFLGALIHSILQSILYNFHG